MAEKVSATFKLGGLNSPDSKRNIGDTLADVDALDSVHVDMNSLQGGIAGNPNSGQLPEMNYDTP